MEADSSPIATRSSRATIRTTPANEAFDPLLLGFSDWGTWWQGEIAGEYFLSNSNLISHQIRVHVTPNDAIGGGLIFYNFRARSARRRSARASRPTTSRSRSTLYMDWKVNSNFTLSLVAAFADPGKAVQQVIGRTKNFTYGMVYLGYSF